MDIFELSARQQDWLALRRSAISGNIANANTPGYRAKDISDFRSYLDDNRHRTDSLAAEQDASSNVGEAVDQDQPGATTHSSNNIDLDVEMLKAADVSRMHALNTGIIRSFNRLFLTAVR